MAYGIVSSVIAGSTNDNDVTTAGIDTSGASLLVLAVASYPFFNPASPTISDSKSNTWTPLGVATFGAFRRVQMHYVANPTVGSGHTFTASLASTLPCIGIIALSGAKKVGPFDQENGAAVGGGTSLQTGSVTPSKDNELLVTALEREEATDTFSIDEGFTILLDEPYDVAGNHHMGLVVAYLIQTSAAAKNPTWSWQNAHNVVATIATFEASNAGGGGAGKGGGGKKGGGGVNIIFPGGALQYNIGNPGLDIGST